MGNSFRRAVSSLIMRKALEKELKNIKNNCTYSAETHHIIALSSKNKAMWFQVVAAVLTALSALLVVGQVVSAWWGFATFTTAVVTAVANVLNPLKNYYDHLNAAKNFTALKHDARALHETFGKNLSDERFSEKTQILHDRYNELIRIVPPTDKKSFEKAREVVGQGIHEPD